MEKLVAYCGGNCAECGAYIAMKNDDQALREKTAIEWTEKFHMTFTPDMINCSSCKSDGVKMGYCSVCEIRKCAIAKNVVDCGACADFKTCKTINGFIAAFPMTRHFSNGNNNQ